MECSPQVVCVDQDLYFHPDVHDINIAQIIRLLSFSLFCWHGSVHVLGEQRIREIDGEEEHFPPLFPSTAP